jgi:hypothetical protein
MTESVLKYFGVLMPISLNLLIHSTSFFSLDFLKTRSWEESDKSVFRVNTPEGYEALNLKSNDKNKHNIILSIG